MENDNMLYEHQKKAIEVFKKKNKLLLTLKPGAGKTRVFMEVLQPPTLVITFKYVIQEQIKQIKEFNPSYTTYVVGKGEIPLGYDVYYATPQRVVSSLDKLMKMKFNFICVDESHMLKTYSSKRTKAVIRLSANNPNAGKLCMSGTPAAEGVFYLYGQINFLMSGGFFKWSDYLKAFAVKTLKPWGFEFVCPPEKERLLTKLFSSLIFTADVKLPDQVLKNIPLRMSTYLRSLYERYLEEMFVEYEANGQNISVLAISSPYTTSKQLCAGFIKRETGELDVLDKGKYLVASDIATSEDSQVIIWGTFRYELELMYQTLNKKSALLIGGCKGGEKIIEDFRSGRIKYLITNPRCIGAGVSLENCARMIYLSVPDSGADYIQSLARTNRVTQKVQERVYFLYYEKSIEQKVLFRTKGKEFSQKLVLEAIREAICG